MDINFSVEVARLRWHHAALRFELSMLRHAQALRRKYNPDQPRVPAGNSDGGLWTRDSRVGVVPNVFDAVLASVFQEPGDVSSPELVVSDENPDAPITVRNMLKPNTRLTIRIHLPGFPGSTRQQGI